MHEMISFRLSIAGYKARAKQVRNTASLVFFVISGQR